jgi:putative ABC transport system ATP-binding protein
MIQLQHIQRDYVMGDQTLHALQNVSLNITKGEYISIMGASGSGKSTLLNVIGLLDRPTAGQYFIDNKEVTSLDDTELAHIRSTYIGFVFQFFHLVPRLTAAENVELPLMLAGVPVAERKQRVDDVLKALEISNRAHHKPQELSGGQRQRVAIARATIMRPRLLLADEPTGNLDHRSGNEVIALLESLQQQGISLVVVTHDPEIGQRATRHITMLDGKIIKDDLESAGQGHASD